MVCRWDRAVYIMENGHGMMVCTCNIIWDYLDIQPLLSAWNEYIYGVCTNTHANVYRKIHMHMQIYMHIRKLPKVPITIILLCVAMFPITFHQLLNEDYSQVLFYSATVELQIQVVWEHSEDLSRCSLDQSHQETDLGEGHSSVW